MSFDEPGKKNKVYANIHTQMKSVLIMGIESCTHSTSTPSARMSAFNNGTRVLKGDLEIGDIVRINTKIDTRDIAEPDSLTANR